MTQRHRSLDPRKWSSNQHSGRAVGIGGFLVCEVCCWGLWFGSASLVPTCCRHRPREPSRGNVVWQNSPNVSEPQHCLLSVKWILQYKWLFGGVLENYLPRVPSCVWRSEVNLWELILCYSQQGWNSRSPGSRASAFTYDLSQQCGVSLCWWFICFFNCIIVTQMMPGISY